MKGLRDRRKAFYGTYDDELHTWSVSGGDVTVIEDYQIPTQYETRYTRIRDVVGEWRKDNELFIEKASVKPMSARFSNIVRGDGWLEGQEDLNSYTAASGVHNDARSFQFGWDEISSDDEFITHACAATNPSAAVFDSAVFLAELRDVPSLLRTSGSHMSKYGANEFLKYQYGWKPLVSDMKKMVTTFDKLAKRVKEIERLAQNQSVKRRYDPPNGGGISRAFGESFSDDHPFYLRSVHKWNLSVKRWAVIKWVPELPDNLSSRLAPITRNLTPLNRAKQALSGAVVDGHTLWQAMPWSWLLDWGHNVSDYLGSNQNIVGGKVGSTCLMKTAVFRRESEFVPGPNPDNLNFEAQNVSSLPGGEVLLAKERKVGIMPSLVAADAFNLIDQSITKQSVLGALGLQRLRRLPSW